MSRPPLSIEELVSLPGPVWPTLFDPALSPDGSRIAFVKRVTDWERDLFLHRVHLCHVETRECAPVTPEESWAPAWSPDGRALAFLAPAGDGRPQIFVTAAGAAPVQITRVGDGVQKYRWCPDGSAFFFLTLAPEAPKLAARRRTYGDFIFVDDEVRRNRLAYQPYQPGSEPGAVTFLTDGSRFDIQEFDVAPDGRRVVFTAAPRPGREFLEQLDLCLLDISTGALTVLRAGRANRNAPRFSPDGTHVAYTFHVDGKFYNNYTVEIVDLAGGSGARPAQNFDEDIDVYAWHSAGLLVAWQERTNRRVGLLTEAGALQALAGGDPGVAAAPSLSRDGQHVAYLLTTDRHTTELFVDGVPVTSESALLPERGLSRRELVCWQSQDGTAVEGILSTPAEGGHARPYPLLVVAHGGPRGLYCPVRTFDEHYPTEQFVAKGFAVLEPNYRGSNGCGQAFRACNYRNWGRGEYADVVSGVARLAAHGLVDPARVGIMGWSQGGYIAAFCATYGSARFRAASAGGSISHWNTFHITTDNRTSAPTYLGATPWEDPEIYRTTAPVTYVRGARTPLLLQHGERDTRAPVASAYELQRALQAEGVPVHLVLFKGMGHFRMQPSQARAIMAQNLAWFSHHLLGEPLAGPVWIV